MTDDVSEGDSGRNETADEADKRLCAVLAPLDAETDYQLKISTESSKTTPWNETASDTIRFSTPPNRKSLRYTLNNQLYVRRIGSIAVASVRF